jgi:putative MATE family efflux protein
LPNNSVTVDTPSYRDVFAMAWPLGLKALMLHGIVVIDAFLVSPLGEEALAAMGLASAIAGLLMGVIFAFSNATQIKIAQAFGAAGPVSLKTSFYCGLFINVGMSLLGLVAVIIFGDDLIARFAHTPAIAQEAVKYLHIFLFVVLFEAVGQCLASHFNGCSKPKVPFYSYLIAIPMNVGLSLVLIHGLYGFPEMGVAGAAVGSAASSFARVAFMIVRGLRDDWDVFGAKGWSRDSFWIALRRHWVFALPIAGTFISMTVATQVCALIYAKMTVNEFAAMTLILPWVNTAGTFGMAWAQATGIIMAQLLGRKLAPEKLDAFIWRAWRGAFVSGALVSVSYLIVILFSGRIYSDLQPETTSALMMFLPVLLILPFPKGSNAICGQTLRAAGDTVRVMNIFNIGQWLCKVPLTVLFVVYLDVPVSWVFALILLDEFVKFPMFHLRIFKGQWKTAQVLDT